MSNKVKYGFCENIWPKNLYTQCKNMFENYFYISQKMLWDYWCPNTYTENMYVPPTQNRMVHTKNLTGNVKYLKFISLKMKLEKWIQESLWEKICNSYWRTHSSKRKKKL